MSKNIEELIQSYGITITFEDLTEENSIAYKLECENIDNLEHVNAILKSHHCEEITQRKNIFNATVQANSLKFFVKSVARFIWGLKQDSYVTIKCSPSEDNFLRKFVNSQLSEDQRTFELKLEKN